MKRLVITVSLLVVLSGWLTAARAAIEYEISCNAIAGLEYDLRCEGLGSLDGFDIYSARAVFEFNGKPASDSEVEIAIRGDYGDVGIQLEAQGGAYDQFYAQSTARAQVTWTDFEYVTSNTLFNGDPASIRLVHGFDSTYVTSENPAGPLSNIRIRNTYGSRVTASYSDPSGNRRVVQDAWWDQRMPSGETDLRTTLILTDATVGTFIALRYEMALSLEVFVEQPAMNISTSTHALAQMNATRSGRVYVDALTPGVVLTSTSGHDYSLPDPAQIPEPATLILLGVGLAGLAASRRRRLN